METDIYGDNHSFATAYDLGIDAAIQSADGASIAIAEEKDYYSFKLTKRATITLTTSGPDDFADTVLYLCDSDEELIGYNDDAGMDGYSRIAQPLDPGTYYVIVNAYGTQTIDEYSLTVSFSNDTIAPVVSNVQADITEPTDQKVTVTAEFSDNVGVASKKYMIGENGYWLDYPSGGVVVTKNKTIYFMAVDEAGNTSAIVPYEVTNIVSGPDIYGDNHSFDTAYDLGTDDAIKSAYGASIDTAGEEDYYTFTLTERATVKLATNGSDYDDTVMYLYDSDQELIAENDENGISSYSLVSKALDPGTYYVVVTAYDNDLIDDYSLTVSFSNDTIAPVVSNVQADITEPTDQKVTVTAEFSDNVGVASKKYMIGENGYWLDYPDDGVVVTENGTVYFMAVDEAGNESEIVSYEVTNIIPAGLVDAYGDNHSFDTAYDLGSDTAIKSADDASVTIAGEVDYFSFTLTQDADVTLRTTGGADSFDTFLYLYDGDQNEIAYNDDYGASYFSCIAERLGPGTYYATVLPYGDDTGKYSLLVTVLPDDGVSVFTGDLAGATKRILDGRSAKDVDVHDGGSLLISSGGSVADTVVNPGGLLEIEDGGKAYNIKENGGYVSVETDRDVMFVPNTIDGLELTDQNCATLHSNTIATNAVITSATLYVYDNGSAVGTTVNHGGLFYIYNGGIASNTDVSSGGNLHIVGGGSAHEIKENGGYVSLEDGADISFVSNSIAGLEMKEWTSASIHSGTTATGVEVKWGCRLEVHAGGIAHQVKESGGFVSIKDGADVKFVSNTFENLEVINGNSATIHSGTTANDTTIDGYGYLFVFDGGTANGASVSSDGNLLVSSGGKLTGNQTYEDGAVVSMAEGAILNFDLRQAEAGAEKALVNDLAIIQGAPVYTLTVNTSLKIGTYDYRLAEGASAFDSTISVEKASGIELDTLALNETVQIGDVNYTLSLTGSVLSVTVEVLAETVADTTPPTVSDIKADITAPTNQNVTVTASFADDEGVAEALYRVGETGEWTAYESGVVLTGNATVYFKAIDTSDNQSEIVSYEVKNIDKVPPVITLTGDNLMPLQEATITASTDDGSPIYYRIGDSGEWTEYREPITVTDNATYNFLSVDAVGNEGTNFLSFANIDRNPPPILLIADTTTPLQSSTITASTEDGLDILYSTDQENWVKYEAPINVTANGTYYFKATDAAGNEGTNFLTFDNIQSEEPAPAKKKWTYMVYMAADSNIGDGALYDIIGMQQAKVDSEIDIYVLADRCPVDAGYPTEVVTVNGTYTWDSLWPETRVGKITYSPGLSVTVDWESWGELDTASSETLKMFVDWAQEQSPADNYGLILWDHGGENAKLCWDLTTDPNWNACFTVSEVSDIVKEKGNIPIVIFNNCLLASEIVATQMAGSTEVIVASEPVSMSESTYNYNAFFNTITADMTPQEMAEIMVQNVVSPGMLTMLSSIDVTDSRLGDALEALADAVAEAGNDADKTVLMNAMFKAHQDGFCYSGSYVQQSDLGDMIRQVMADSSFENTSAGFKKALADVKSVLEEVVLAIRSVPVNRGTGIAYCNTIATILQCYVTGRAPEKMKSLIQSHLTSSYKSNPLWGGLLYDLGTTFWDQNQDQLFHPASFDVMDVEGLVEGRTISAKDLGCFSGKGEQNYGIALFGEAFCRIVITDADKSTGTINVNNESGKEIRASLLASDGSVVVAEKNQSISFENLAPGNYYLRLQSETNCDVTVTFDANWMTGVDRFDYAGNGQNLPGVNGNGSIDTATILDAGYYTGLLTCKGDTDYYRIGNIHTEQYTVVINGNADWTVAEYDKNGTLVRKGQYSELDNIITLTMDSMNYLLVEGTADMSKPEVNRYFLNVFKNENGSGDVVQLDDLTGSKDEVSWESSAISDYVVEYSTDDFEHVLRYGTRGTAVDMLNLPVGTYQWRVKANMNNAEWNDGNAIVSDTASAVPKVFRSKADASDDIFFATPNGVWGRFYYAQHVGSVDDWTGTNEIVSANGKGRIQDLFFGSADPSTLCLTDSENGDALFLDDAYTGLPEEIEENTARLLRVQMISAGAGDDIVDMTSQSFEYTDGKLSIFGGDGDDTIWASKGKNSLYGDAGNDRIVGASGDDVIVGGIGNDRMHGGGGDDIFTFCDNWGVDEVEQLTGGKVTLWFASGSLDNWNSDMRTYSDGTNGVTVKGGASVELKFGNDGSAQYGMLSSIGAFTEFTTQKIFEESGKGNLASLS